MHVINLEKWAIVAPNNETGVGRMTQDLRRLLDPIRVLVAPNRRLKSNPLSGRDAMLVWEQGGEVLQSQLAGLHGIILFEDSEYAHKTIEAASSMGIKVVMFVLWEWFRYYAKIWQSCDVFVCNTGFSAQLMRKFGFRNTVQLTWPVDVASLPNRIRSGPARVFVHNAGLFEKDDRKATVETLEAFSLVRKPEIQLIVRVQNELTVSINDSRIQIKRGNLADFRDLYKEGDVAVHPSKCEGLGFALLEAMASGMPLITTDYPPMNEYVTRKSMLVATKWGKYPAEQTQYIPQAHFKLPKVKDLASKISWCAENDMGAISRENRAWAEQVFAPARLREQWLTQLCQIEGA
ncbi:MAG: glycosyltransferase family 4 protein [Verrucomicrobiota bacterium]